MLFPEGTRSPDGRLQTYKTGAFRLALETRSAILPVVITGTHDAIKKGGLLIHKNDKVRLMVLDPVPYESFRDMDAKELSMLVFSKTQEVLKTYI